MGAYGRLCTAFYDLDKPVAPPDAIMHYRRLAARASGPVLEPMCGSGRFLIPLLQAGIPVEGVDASPDMLAACRRRATRLGLAPTLYEQTLERLALPHRYGLGFIPAGSLGLVHATEALRACLRGLRRHLAPAARLVIELDADEAVASEAGARAVTDALGRTLAHEWRSTFDPGTMTVRYDSRYVLRDGDAVLAEEPEEILLRKYATEEIVGELQRAGFADVHVLPTTDAMAWLRTSGCAMIECNVPDAGTGSSDGRPS